MKTLVTILAIVALVCVATSAMAAITISQVYSGGGSSSTSATYKTDYVELFNSGSADVNIGTWAIEYGSATGNWGSSTLNYYVLPAGTIIKARRYLFVAVGSAGSGGGNFPVTPDLANTVGPNLGAAAGKVALFSALNSNVACGSETPGTLVDKVAWGTATCAEGTAVGALSVSTGAVRACGGQTDTNNNSADFSIVTNPVPRNKYYGTNVNCVTTPTKPSTWGSLRNIYR